MSLGKAVYYGKEFRKPYRKSKRFDWSCRNHGACTYCRNNRTYADRKWRSAADEQLREAQMNGGEE